MASNKIIRLNKDLTLSSLNRLNNLITVTKKLINESELELLRDVFNALGLELYLTDIPNDDIFILRSGYTFNKLTDVITQNKDKITEALRLVDILICRNPNYFLYHFMKGLLINAGYGFLSNLESEKYICYYEKSQELCPNSFFSNYLLSRDLYMGGDEYDSRNLMLKCIKILQESSISQQVLEMQLLEMAYWCEINVSFYEMSQCYFRLIEISPDNPEYHFMNSYAQYKYGDYEGAKYSRDIYIRLCKGSSYKEGWWFKYLDNYLPK